MDRRYSFPRCRVLVEPDPPGRGDFMPSMWTGETSPYLRSPGSLRPLCFRFKHNRSGHCFQGRYGSKLVESDDYLVRLTRYIHLNPVKTCRFKDASNKEKKAFLEGCRWSSYSGYTQLGMKSLRNRPRMTWMQPDSASRIQAMQPGRSSKRRH